MTLRRLYHFTCRHAAAGIHQAGELRPNGHPWLPEPLVWLTDLEDAWREALGLTSHTLYCDRTECRFRAATTSSAVPWTVYRRSVPVRAAHALEREPGVMPAHWWVSLLPVPIVRPATPAKETADAC